MANKISNLIKDLLELRRTHGDLEVVIATGKIGPFMSVKEADIWGTPEHLKTIDVDGYSVEVLARGTSEARPVLVMKWYGL